ncbi:ABC-2 type transport system permease protein [Motilibacter peucedani]|uniref:ABC-2 type transport system permease protein n=2 Tax=Motilibacter peucedani TaxID=598650 RepID=A0A420XLV1_9ACTN|nr:ABC-2 type transport system permease protein [Motilibacter peucedani]
MSMFGLGLRALLFRSRTIALALLPLVVGAICAALAFSAQQSDLERVYPRLGADLFVSQLVALVALVLGVNAFDDERDSGTLPLLLATSTPRWRIVGAKLVAAWVATVLISLPGLVGCALLGSQAGLSTGEVWGSLFGALLLSAAGYVAVFVLLSLLTARSLLIGLGYVVVWEGSFATYVKSLRNLSIGSFGRRLIGSLYPDKGIPFKVADVGVTGAVVVLVAVSAVAAVLAVRRLPHVDATASGAG